MITGGDVNIFLTLRPGFGAFDCEPYHSLHWTTVL